jgi:hypothetical protein
VAITTLSKEDQELLLKHGHIDAWEISVYRYNGKKPSSICVECVRCNEVLIELVGRREQEV